VLLSDEDVNLKQIQAGLGWHYKKYQREQSVSDRVKYAVREARRVKLGLWHDAKPVAPCEYRQAKRQREKDLEPFMGNSGVWTTP
jgi:endonuclease YncB( thermonuclease family)